MGANIVVVSNINVRKVVELVDNDKLWLFAANEWWRLYEPWVPMQSGTLYNQVTVTPGQIEHTVPYAHYQYNGKDFNFRTDKHALASAEWDQAAKPTQESKLISALQDFIDKELG
jgi:hypothetical protein